MNKILIIQTAFIGDAILITPIIEAIHQASPDTKIDVLVRHDSSGLFENHPYINHTIVWNKKHQKYLQLFFIIFRLRKKQYDLVVNAHRFFSTGLITILIGAKKTIGFTKNPSCPPESPVITRPALYNVLTGQAHLQLVNMGYLGGELEIQRKNLDLLEICA